jgi:signal peptidase I
MTEEHRKSAIRDTFESLLVTVILAVFGTTFVLQAFKIPTGSMENTLLIGDHLLVNKFIFAAHSSALDPLLPYRDIRRDDIVVFKYPYDDQAQEPGEHLVKRVIGVPGSRIKLVNRRLFVDGQAVKEPFVNYGDPPDLSQPADDFPPADPDLASYMTARWAMEYQKYVKDGELVVPPGKYFVMGDHRERSWDGRFWGFVPREMIQGRPLFIYWSFETPPDEYQRTSPGDRLSQIADLVVHFISKTRWRRTLKFVR